MDFLRSILASVMLVVNSVFGMQISSTVAPLPPVDPAMAAIEQRIRDELPGRGGDKTTARKGSSEPAPTTPTPDARTPLVAGQDSSTCVVSASDPGMSAELQRLDAEIDRISAQAGPGALEESLALMRKADELESRRAAVAASLAKKEAASIASPIRKRIFDAYCGASIVRASQSSTLASQTLHDQMAPLSFSRLACSLDKNEYHGPQVPVALYYMGLKLSQAGNFDDAYAYYRCAAENYLHLFSMYRVAQVYKHGSAELAQGDTVKNAVQPDAGKAYFWLAAIAHAESLQKLGVLDTGRTIGWNIIAMIDDLQNTGVLSSGEMKRIEQEAISFVGETYPSVLQTSGSVYSHSMDAVIIELEKAGGR